MIRIISHNDIKSKLLQEIVKVKQLSWNYTLEEHLLWIQDNLKGDDCHFLYYDNDEFVAYMNLVNVVIRSEDILIPVFGIGNVCAKYKGKGYGKRLLEEVNKFIRTRNEKGMLFCKS